MPELLRGVAEESGGEFAVVKNGGERAGCSLSAVVSVYGLIFGAKNVYGMCQKEHYDWTSDILFPYP